MNLAERVLAAQKGGRGIPTEPGAPAGPATPARAVTEPGGWSSLT